jgi:pimeloyl-ACP methyl ester carboxylesterase
MLLVRRLQIIALTLLLVAVFSGFAWSDENPHHSFHVDVVGRGRPMILIPGLSSSPDAWTTTVARYRDRYECHVLTLAGFVGRPPIAEPLIGTVRKELAAYIRDRHLDRPVIVGHSLGGTLAMAVAIDHPDLVGPLVIVDMVPFLGGERRAWRRVRHHAREARRPRHRAVAVCARRGRLSGPGGLPVPAVLRHAQHDVRRSWKGPPYFLSAALDPFRIFSIE